ncbi:Outer membrane protein assembly factor BamA [Buchnera aphidicola (Periphyllus testudinaceus)]|uniref:outer membrane protein assembly factor BamA n=1 Tax=Buchnera aphidicola TaxID=9 RepID=UPI003463A25F
MKIKNLFLICLFIFSINIGYSNNNFYFKKIEFSGLNKISQKEALGYLTFHTNEFVSKKEIQNSIQQLLLSNKFETVDFFQSHKKITFKVKENPFISKINILGHFSIDLSLIQDFLNSSGIQENTFLSNHKKMFFKNKILEYYTSILKDNSKVIFKILNKKNNIQDLTIKILEGNDLDIKKIKILGNSQISSDRVMSFFSSYNRSKFLKKFINYKYNYQDFQNDLKSLYHFYNNAGYVNFNIINTKLNYLNKKKDISIIMTINEGCQCTLSDVIIKEDYPTLFKPLEFTSLFKINELYHIDDLMNFKKNIEKKLFKNGYIFSEIEIVPYIDNFHKKVKFVINIHKNEQFLVNEILFKGNVLTEKKYLIKKMLQKEKAIVNADFLNKDLKYLKETEYFDNIEVEFKAACNKKYHFIDLIYNVKEKKSNICNFGIGYNNQNKLNFNLQLLKKHFLKTGNVLSFGVSQYFNKHSFNFFYINPYFTKKNFIFSTNFFLELMEPNLNIYSNDSKKFQENYINKIYLSIKNILNLNRMYSKYHQFNYGGESSISIPFLNNDLYKINFGYTHHEFSDLIKNSYKNILICKNNFNKVLNKKFISERNSFYIDNSVNFNTINDTFFPYLGHDTTFSLRSLFFNKKSNKNYYKFIFDSKQYFPVKYTNNKVVFLFRSYFGFDFLNKNDMYYENYDNFYAERNNTIRGYLSENIGAKIFYLDKKKIDPYKFKKNNFSDLNKNNNNSYNDYIGGNIISITNLELISSIPYFKNEYLKNFRISTFLDFGSVWIQNKFFKNSPSIFVYSNPNKIFSSCGLSLKWKSPFGLLSFSYAFPLSYNDKNDIEKFQISFGR